MKQPLRAKARAGANSAIGLLTLTVAKTKPMPTSARGT